MRFDRSAYLCFAILFALDIFVWFQMFSGAPARAEKAYFLNVGQGDSELLVFPGNYKVLIDGGPDGSVIRELERILPASDKYLDLAVITHPQKDHFGGFAELLGSYRIGAFVWNGREPDQEPDKWKELEKEIRSRGIPLIALKRGDRIRLSGGDLMVLSPDEALWESSESNDNAIALLAGWPNFRGLFASDAGSAAEKLLAGDDIRADILKVGHHGSKYSSSREFLNRILPRISVVEVGRGNLYGHPAPEALARLAAADSKVFRTDRNGTVEIEWRNGKLAVFPERR